MRTGEVGQLNCADIKTDGEHCYFDLRPFNAREGRVALKDLWNLKTNAAGRGLTIHPLLIELGLLDRTEDMMDRNEARLFPEWEPYHRSDGAVRWSQPRVRHSGRDASTHSIVVTGLNPVIHVWHCE